jgi:Na+/proline symporter
LLVVGVVAIVMISQADPAATSSGISRLTTNFEPSNIGIDFFVITLLSMAAIFCLPRQFYMTVIQADSSRDITRARWPFVAYMVVTLLVVLPISVAGIALFSAEIRPDTYVLQLPLSQQMSTTTLLVFLGGFSAATAMVLVETIALSTMVSNDLIAPLLVRSDRLKGEGDLGRAIILTRRIVLAAIMLTALGWALGISDHQQLGRQSDSSPSPQWPSLRLRLFLRCWAVTATLRRLRPV